MQNIQTIFFGTSQFAILGIQALIDAKYNVTAVITQPDKPTGRKQVFSPSPVKMFAKKHSIKTLQPNSLKDDDTFQTFKDLNPDLCVVAAYGKIIPRRYLDVPKYGFINIHPSLLPKYRGPSPIQTAILNGETETGITITVVDEEMDHGPILAQREWATTNPITKNVNTLQVPHFLNSKLNYQQLHDFLAKEGAKLLVETLPKYINGETKLELQDHSKATFTKKFSREDGRINWNEPAEKIDNQIQALNPEPGTWTTWKGKVINIPTSNFGYSQKEELRPGTIMSVDKKIAIATSKGYLILTFLQLEGRKETDAKSFVNGYPDFLSSILE